MRLTWSSLLWDSVYIWLELSIAGLRSRKQREMISSKEKKKTETPFLYFFFFSFPDARRVSCGAGSLRSIKGSEAANNYCGSPDFFLLLLLRRSVLWSLRFPIDWSILFLIRRGTRVIMNCIFVEKSLCAGVRPASERGCEFRALLTLPFCYSNVQRKNQHSIREWRRNVFLQIRLYNLKVTSFPPKFGLRRNESVQVEHFCSINHRSVFFAANVICDASKFGRARDEFYFRFLFPLGKKMLEKKRAHT